MIPKKEQKQLLTEIMEADSKDGLYKSMEKEFIPYDEAIELKKLGFDIPSVSGYSYTGSYNLLAAAILYQQAFRWFREKYGLHQHIEYVKVADRYDWWVGSNLSYCKTYEEAELACLRKLIEIVKKQVNHE